MGSKLLLTILMLIGTCISTNVMANAFDDLFQDAMSNTSPSGRIDSQRRNHLVVGGLSVRLPVVRETLFGFTPPSLELGCGGIDAFGGALSFPDKDQFVQTLRAIGANSAGYFFELALAGLCPTCLQEMKDLNALIQKINAKNIDSCEAAQYMVNAVTPEAWQKKQQPITDQVGVVNGIYRDFFESKNSTDDTQKKITDSGDPQAYVNVTWNALKTSGFEDFKWGLKSGDKAFDVSLLEIAMNMIGTLVYRPLADAELKANKDTVGWDTIPGTLKFQHFMFGIPDADPQKIYLCPAGMTGANQCLINASINTGLLTSSDWPGFHTKIQGILTGDGTNPGLINKFRLKNGTLTADEQMLIQIAPSSLMSMLKKLSRQTSVAEAFSERVAMEVSFDLTWQYIVTMMNATQIALHNADDDRSAMMLKKISQIRTDYRNERIRLVSALRTSKETIEAFKAIDTSQQYSTN